jgi:hypothetical protein
LSAIAVLSEKTQTIKSKISANPRSLSAEVRRSHRRRHCLKTDPQRLAPDTPVVVYLDLQLEHIAEE